VIVSIIKLFRKDISWVWKSEQIEAFRVFKKAFMTVPVLAYFNYIKKTVIETDVFN
jgi:hypothetical protein